MAICLDLDWQTNEFMLYCRTTQLREKTMLSYEQTLRLFEKWCKEEQSISTVDKVNENVIRRYIFDLQGRGKYTFYANDKQKAGAFRKREAPADNRAGIAWPPPPPKKADTGISPCLPLLRFTATGRAFPAGGQ